MILVRAVTADEWRLLREVRLAALWEAPYAFGSTYAEQVAFTEQDWRTRAARGSTFLAYLPTHAGDSGPVGLAGGYTEAPGSAELISMWVNPLARGQGVGAALIARVAGWATEAGATTLRLWVTETNEPALRLYRRCGFTLTGERQPLPSAPSLGEVAMSRSVAELGADTEQPDGPSAGEPVQRG